MALDQRSVAIGVLALLAAAAVGVAAGAVLGERSTTAGRAGPVGTTPAPAAAPSTTGAPSPVPSGPTVPVYVLGDTEGGPRLYREFRRGGGGEADAVAAAAAALADKPADPDYRTPWTGVGVRRLTRSGGTVTVEFGGAPRLSGPMEAAVAVQQVVHTVTAADPRVKRVRVVAPGLPASLTSAAVGRAGQLDVLAPIWLLSPADGSRAGRRVVLRGTASVFEATVNVEVRRGADVVAKATATATVGAPERGDWTTTVTLPPGDYVLAAYEVSAKDGTRLSVDTKRVTVA